MLPRVGEDLSNEFRRFHARLARSGHIVGNIRRAADGTLRLKHYAGRGALRTKDQRCDEQQNAAGQSRHASLTKRGQSSPVGHTLHTAMSGCT